MTPIAGISSMATRALIADLVDAWRHRGGADVAFESVGGVDAARRVFDGERFDCAVLAADAIDRLIAAGRIDAGSRTEIARSQVGIAVRRGAHKPNVESVAALREALLAARSIGISTGPSGNALQRLIASWGIAEALADRLVIAAPGVPVAASIARGDVALGFQQYSELIGVDGIDVVGMMPAEAAILTVFAGGVCVGSSRGDDARALLEFFASPAADASMRRHGMSAARLRVHE